MELATGLISLAALIGGFLFWWLKRKSELQIDPVAQNEKRHDQISKDVATGDSETNTDHLIDDLDHIERLRREREKGAGGSRGSSTNSFEKR